MLIATYIYNYFYIYVYVFNFFKFIPVLVTLIQHLRIFLDFSISVFENFYLRWWEMWIWLSSIYLLSQLTYLLKGTNPQPSSCLLHLSPLQIHHFICQPSGSLLLPDHHISLPSLPCFLGRKWNWKRMDRYFKRLLNWILSIQVCTSLD